MSTITFGKKKQNGGKRSGRQNLGFLSCPSHDGI